MIERFEAYLSKEFKGLPKSREVNDLKDELLGTLMEKAEELKAAGKSDDEVFKLSINSISGFKDTLKVMRSKPIIQKEVANAATKLLYFAIYVLVLIGVFLAVSFLKGGWKITWLIVVEGIFAGLVFMLMVGAAKGLAKNKIVLPRVSLLSAVSLATVGMYLGVSLIMGIWSKSWIIMLFLPTFLMLAELIIDISTKRMRPALATTLGLIPTAAVAVYVSLSFLHIITWHPYWLIVLVAVIVDAIILAVAVRARVNRK